MSVFHRVDDIYSMEAPDFFRKSFRLKAYKGAVRMSLQELAETQPTVQSPAAPLRPAPAVSGRSGPGRPPIPRKAAGGQQMSVAEGMLVAPGVIGKRVR